ncbi:hypothetical protein CRE_10564 [Caenorhabditis remanei]|uniref:Uncharacterized protein n=1 Tax=Caenorhabditis remanei TaxID=31234 RepID=E3N7A5_CAERE|nr:hypothetical protein CRE_10564 [Caenorhabditis remanei]
MNLGLKTKSITGLIIGLVGSCLTSIIARLLFTHVYTGIEHALIAAITLNSPLVLILFQYFFIFQAKLNCRVVSPRNSKVSWAIVLLNFLIFGMTIYLYIEDFVIIMCLPVAYEFGHTLITMSTLVELVRVLRGKIELREAGVSNQNFEEENIVELGELVNLENGENEVRAEDLIAS